MIGIDLTDLSDPLLQDRGKAQRFISHPRDHSPELVHRFWYLWTSKEAVFKAARQPSPFRPKSIPVRFLNEHRFISGELTGSVIESDGYILSIVATSAEVRHVVLERETDFLSIEIRQKIRHWFWDHLQVNTTVACDHHNLPILSHNASPISITHHGRYMAFAFVQE